MLKTTFYSNGKLLITGEYVVLDGAKAFALPTKFGQYFTVENCFEKNIYWKSYDSNKSLWFETVLTFEEILNKENKDTSNSVKNTLIDILHVAFDMNADILHHSGFIITTQLTFPRNWGLGTSSTLINNIAQWLQIDAFELLHKSFGGSGYDIACAQNNTPICYQIKNEKAIVESTPFNPQFKNHLYFVYLNQKQSSKSAIQSYYNKKGNVSELISKINLITQTILTTNDINIFAKNIQIHENEMSEILELETVQESLFNDFDGVIKSLGAWGGDFVMAISKENPTHYFNQKGYQTVLSYKEMIL